MILAIVILSFYLEGFVSNFVSVEGVLVPAFTMISLLLIYPYYCNNNLGFLVSAGIIGVLYDITYTNTLFLNAIIFIILSLLIIKLYQYINNNIFNTIIISILLIILYRLITYIFLVIIGYFTFDFVMVFKSIYSSIIINIIYTFIVYLIALQVAKRFKIKRMD